METFIANSAGLKILRDKNERLFGETTTSTMTPADIKKYGQAIIYENKNKGGNEVKQLNIPVEKLIEICKKNGSGVPAQKIIAEQFGITQKQAENQITHRVKLKMTQEEAAETISKAVAIARNPLQAWEETAVELANWKSTPKPKFYISTAWGNKAKAAELGEIVEKLENEITCKWYI